MILILSNDDDVHGRAVRRELDRLGAEHRVLDLSEFPVRAGVSLFYGDRGGAEYRFADEGALDLDRVTSVWWRRPQPYGLDPSITDGDHARFAFNECHETLVGLWHGLDARWINDPALDERAHRKTYQWRVAQAVGLELPATLVTNQPDAARAFVRRHSAAKTVYKAFSATPRIWRETRILGEDEAQLLDLVQLAPVIFQEYVPGVDIRATIVGDDIHAAEIDARRTAYPVDFRMNFDNIEIVPVDLPSGLQAQIRMLRDRLGLTYGALDFRRTDDGRHVFLEVNPAGQWLFVEHATGQPITAALAQRLVGQDLPRHTTGQL